MYHSLRHWEFTPCTLHPHTLHRTLDFAYVQISFVDSCFVTNTWQPLTLRISYPFLSSPISLFQYPTVLCFLRYIEDSETLFHQTLQADHAVWPFFLCFRPVALDRIFT